MAGIDTNAKVSDLTDEQMGALQMAKIKKESPGLAKILTQQAASGAAQGGITSEMILKFNDDVSRRKMGDAEVKQIADAKKKVMSDPNSEITDVLAWSAGGKNIGETQSKAIIKFEQAMSQIDAIQKQVKKMDT